jgi:hypothetical protein
MGRRPTQGPKWTPEEDAVLILYYRAYGAKRVQRTIKRKGLGERTIPSIWHRARRLDLPYDPTKGGKFAYLVDAHPDNVGRDHTRKAKAHRHIVRAARKDGVLTRSTLYPFRAMAPTEWVDAYMQKLAEQFDEAEEVHAEWLSSREMAELFGFSERSFSVLAAPSCQKRYSLHEYLARIPQRNLKVRTPSRSVKGKFWRAEEAKREARLYQARRARRRMRNGKP